MNLVISTRIKKPWKYLQGLIAGDVFEPTTSAFYTPINEVHNGVVAGS
jgi:hypothetical protein